MTANGFDDTASAEPPAAPAAKPKTNMLQDRTSNDTSSTGRNIHAASPVIMPSMLVILLIMRVIIAPAAKPKTNMLQDSGFNGGYIKTNYMFT